MTFGLYVHIPFCIRKCNYCDFLSFPAGEETREHYCRALMEEIKRTAQTVYGFDKAGPPVSEAGRPVSSVFFGGGTPSVLTGQQISRLMDCIRRDFPLKADAEISIEANPGTLDEEKLYSFLDAGVNRLSIGLQSTRDQLLETLGRIHTFKEFEAGYALARQAGFHNINIDIMSALPGQSLLDYRRTLNTVLDFMPEHISSYSLIIEEGTPFACDVDLISRLPGEEEDREMYQMTKELLADRGYDRYEISNYARPGRQCRHNVGYWDGSPYLGVGLGASSYYAHARFSNGRNLPGYLRTPFIPFERRADYEIQTPKEEMEDRMIFGLRMMQGVSRKEFAEEFGTEIESIYGKQIKEFTRLGLLEYSSGRIRLTDQGIDVSNRIFEEFLLG